MNSAVVIFLDNVSKVEQLVESGVVLRDAFTPVYPLRLLETHDLKDAWRGFNNTTRQYTWAHCQDNSLSLARLDRFYCFKYHFGIFKNCHIIPYTRNITKHITGFLQDLETEVQNLLGCTGNRGRCKSRLEFNPQGMDLTSSDGQIQSMKAGIHPGFASYQGETAFTKSIEGLGLQESVFLLELKNAGATVAEALRSERNVEQLLSYWRACLTGRERQLLREHSQRVTSPCLPDHPFLSLVIRPGPDQKQDVTLETAESKTLTGLMVRSLNRQRLERRSRSPWRAKLALGEEVRP
ncbi:hypothetical protein D4764_16G0000060 [Takifugu flavidus]|uniref:Uncharacterized protein n=1 Tax=Takifugu flavidus TaxID=433684 RepID=A0A5C6NXX1_9TELE|nr:hypothetical protein D4764_16G0000060 [Takifugu flavidus]